MHEALNELMAMWARSPLPDHAALQRILIRVYQAGLAETTDLDAARWRLMESEFGEARAKFGGYRPITSTFVPASWTPSPHIHAATRWQFECEWIDVSGSADTIPKLITQMAGKKQLAPV
jgi:hypothetical protein